jgi:hypothetical protein
MVSRRAVTALFLAQLIALAVSAQEFGNATSGELVMTPKGAAPFSGSLELSLSTGGVFGRGNAKGYGLTAGGTLLQDRVWFFAAASQQETSSAIGGRLNGQVAGSQDFSAFFEAARRPERPAGAPSSFGGSVPSSFLSLRYNGIVSSNMLFSASYTRDSRSALTIP